MTRMNAIVCMYSRCSGTRIRCCTNQVMKLASVITKMTAIDIPFAVSYCFETPRNGQQPRKRFMTKLLTSRPPTRIVSRFAQMLLMLPPPSFSTYSTVH